MERPVWPIVWEMRKYYTESWRKGIKRKKADWIGHISRRNCSRLLKERWKKGYKWREYEENVWAATRCLKEMTGHWKLKEVAPDRTVDSLIWKRLQASRKKKYGMTAVTTRVLERRLADQHACIRTSSRRRTRVLSVIFLGPQQIRFPRSTTASSRSPLNVNQNAVPVQPSQCSANFVIMLPSYMNIEFSLNIATVELISYSEYSKRVQFLPSHFPNCVQSSFTVRMSGHCLGTL
jgi:hypothetical protein